ncbi:unnamed protein product [Rotaria sp. Silwood2]|nr:unnamed protein product [Rotaria sp. Silwood2]
MSQQPTSNNSIYNEQQCASNSSAVHMNMQNHPGQQMLLPHFHSSQSQAGLSNNLCPISISNFNNMNHQSTPNVPYIPHSSTSNLCHCLIINLITSL